LGGGSSTHSKKLSAASPVMTQFPRFVLRMAASKDKKTE
jgi:hypothetical protein